MISRKFEYLIALAKEGHFARAAAVCNVSQPALSAGIHHLEQELGVQLVMRGQRYQGLTEEGEIVLAWAQRVGADCKWLQEELRNRSVQTGRTLRLGVMGTTTPFTSVFTPVNSTNGPFGAYHRRPHDGSCPPPGPYVHRYVHRVLRTGR